MNIIIALDDCIRNISSIKSELQNITEKQWLDYKSLTIPHFRAEEKINKWYDEGHNIHIIANRDQYDLKWLKDHYIPYDSIVEDITKVKPDFWIDSSLNRCFDIYYKLKKVFLINENLSDKIIEDSCKSLCLSYPLPNKIKFTNWNAVSIYD